ncbi:MAG: hypothetical protein Q9181_008292 [Wetmoreana brouardii]
MGLPPMAPPPLTPLPELPLEAKAPTPPPTPRNASHLYGEYSWPSLDVATLTEKLEDVLETSQDYESYDCHAATNDESDEGEWSIVPFSATDREHEEYPSTAATNKESSPRTNKKCGAQETSLHHDDYVNEQCPVSRMSLSTSTSSTEKGRRSQAIQHAKTPSQSLTSPEDKDDAKSDSDAGYHTCSKDDDDRPGVKGASTDPPELLPLLDWLRGFERGLGDRTVIVVTSIGRDGLLYSAVFKASKKNEKGMGSDFQRGFSEMEYRPQYTGFYRWLRGLRVEMFPGRRAELVARVNADGQVVRYKVIVKTDRGEVFKTWERKDPGSGLS